MPLSYILRRFAQDTGINCFTTASQEANLDDRQYAVDIVNEAVKQFWMDKDHNGSLRECVVLCIGSQQITTPSFVGIVRAIRQHSNNLRWSLSDMRPLYHKDSWAEEFYNNFRGKGYVAIARDISNSAPPIAIVTKIENPPVKITIVGSTEDAQSVNETITLTQLSNNFTTSFTEITSISKDRINTCNILIQDSDNLDLALLYNNELNTSYQLFDVGSLVNSADVTTPIALEVLYKLPVPIFANDTDEFPLQNYDDVILNKALALYFGKKDNGAKAIAIDSIANSNADKISGDQHKGKDMRIEFERPAHSNLFSSLRHGRNIFRRNNRYY